MEVVGAVVGSETELERGEFVGVALKDVGQAGGEDKLVYLPDDGGDCNGAVGAWVGLRLGLGVLVNDAYT